jgi:uncharacterized phage-associated protein
LDPSFKEEIYAWEHGPVVREVWDAYKANGNTPIDCIYEPSDDNLFEKVNREDNIRNVLEATFVNYCKYSAWYFRNKTHEETPWKTTPYNGVIEKSKIYEFFSKEVLES